MRTTGYFPVPQSESPFSKDPLGTQASPRSLWLIVGNLRLWFLQSGVFSSLYPPYGGRQEGVKEEGTL